MKHLREAHTAVQQDLIHSHIVTPKEPMPLPTLSEYPFPGKPRKRNPSWLDYSAADYACEKNFDKKSLQVDFQRLDMSKWC